MCECFCGCQRTGSPNHEGLCVQCDLGEHPITDPMKFQHSKFSSEPERDTVEKMARYFEENYPEEM